MKKGIYEHFKGGRYELLGTVIHSETLEEMVLYKSLKDEGLWVRPIKMWNEEVLHEGIKVKRFTLIQELR